MLGVLFLVVLVSKGKITVFIRVFQTGKLLVKVCLINRNHWHVYLCTCTVQLLRLFLINNLRLVISKWLSVPCSMTNVISITINSRRDEFVISSKTKRLQ